MSRDTLAAEQRQPVADAVSRVVQRELARGRSARLRSARRRAAAQRTREFERLALSTLGRR